MHSWQFLALPILVAASLNIPSSVAAQVHQYRNRASVPVWLLRLRPIQLRPVRGTMGLSGLRAACSSESARGSTVPATSTATLIIALIRITATLVRTRNAETSPSIISTETRCGMGAATPAAEVIARKRRQTQRFCRKRSLTCCPANRNAWPGALDAGVNHLRGIRVAQRLLPTGVGKQVFSLEAGYPHETLYLKGRGECRRRLVLVNDEL